MYCVNGAEILTNRAAVAIILEVAHMMMVIAITEKGEKKMAEYEVRDVVCDYGVYEDGELKLILNSRRIALQIVELIKEDERIHRELNHIKDYPPYLDRPKHAHTSKERGGEK